MFDLIGRLAKTKYAPAASRVILWLFEVLLCVKPESAISCVHCRADGLTSLRLVLETVRTAVPENMVLEDATFSKNREVVPRLSVFAEVSNALAYTST